MRRVVTAAVAAGAMVASGCASADAGHEITVYAAASLTDVFGQLETAFERSHPEVDVTLVFGGSSALAAQIAEGAPADVFASADQAQMGVAAPFLASEPQMFATNTLTLVVPHGNPGGVAGLAALADPELVSVICAPQVPCGASTLALADAESIALRPASQEGSVTDVLGKVSTGQADAGVVYVTDVARAGGVEQVTIDGASAVTNLYPIAPLAEADEPELASAFVDFVTGADGQALLAAAGFGAP